MLISDKRELKTNYLKGPEECIANRYKKRTIINLNLSNITDFHTNFEVHYSFQNIGSKTRYN